MARSIDDTRERLSYFIIILMLFVWSAFLGDLRQAAAPPATAAQNYTDDVYDAVHVAATDLQNMENNFACLKSSFSGGSAPANPVPGMFWYDTTDNFLKLRNKANAAWLNVYDFANQRTPLALNCSRTVVGGTGISVSGSLNGGNATVSLSAGGVSLSHLAPYTAGSRGLISAGGGGATAASYTKTIEIQLDRGGTIRTRFGLRSSSSGGTAYGRIYRNGAAVGAARSTTTTDFIYYSEDIGGWSAGDLVQLYIYNSAGKVAYSTALDLTVGNWYALRSNLVIF